MANPGENLDRIAALLEDLPERLASLIEYDRGPRRLAEPSQERSSQASQPFDLPELPAVLERRIAPVLKMIKEIMELVEFFVSLSSDAAHLPTSAIVGGGSPFPANPRRKDRGEEEIPNVIPHVDLEVPQPASRGQERTPYLLPPRPFGDLPPNGPQLPPSVPYLGGGTPEFPKPELPVVPKAAGIEKEIAPDRDAPPWLVDLVDGLENLLDAVKGLTDAMGKAGQENKGDYRDAAGTDSVGPAVIQKTAGTGTAPRPAPGLGGTEERKESGLSKVGRALGEILPHLLP